jgi:hypothetical protein
METLSPELFTFAASVKYSEHYKVDPIAGTFIPHSAPIFFKAFANLYDIPFYHLLFGVLTKFFIAGGFLMLTWKLTRSVLACFLAQIMLFGLSDFLVLGVDMPMGTMTHGIRKPLYFTFRQIAIVFAIAATVFFLDKRYLLSCVLLTFGFYFHSFNILAFFMSFNAALAIAFLVKEDKAESIGAALKLSLPFLVLISPYLWMNRKMFGEIIPISSSLWWDFLLKNEPDDVSILFNITSGGFIKELLLTLVAALLYAGLKSEKPVTNGALKAFVKDKRDLVLPLLVAPWALALFAAVWEGALIYRVPDFLNDIFIPLQLRRLPTVSAFLYIPIFAGFIARFMLVVTKMSLTELSGQDPQDLSVFKRRVTASSLDVLWGLALSFLLVIFISVRGSSKGVDLQGFWNFRHMRDDFFLLQAKSPIYRVEDNSSHAEIPSSAFLDVCRFVRSHTPLEAGFFNPTYIGWFRAYCERQGFLSEKDDGGFALYNRKLATIYLQRFSDIHKGLTYQDLPGIVFVGGEPYAIMRQRYLSLDGSDIERLKMLYPGYQYFLTEVGHELPYPKVYANNYFLIYDIERKAPTQ